MIHLGEPRRRADRRQYRFRPAARAALAASSMTPIRATGPDHDPRVGQLRDREGDGREREEDHAEERKDPGVEHRVEGSLPSQIISTKILAIRAKLDLNISSPPIDEPARAMGGWTER